MLSGRTYISSLSGQHVYLLLAGSVLDFAPSVVSSTLVITILEYMSVFETSKRVNSKFGRNLYNVLSSRTKPIRDLSIRRVLPLFCGEAAKGGARRLREGEGKSAPGPEGCAGQRTGPGGKHKRTRFAAYSASAAPSDLQAAWASSSGASLQITLSQASTAPSAAQVSSQLRIHSPSPQP